MRSVLFQAGPFAVHSYGVMLAVAFLAAILWSRREMSRAGLPPDWVFDAAVYVIAASILGGRLVYVLLDFGSYAAKPGEILQVQLGGLSIHGGIAGGVAAVAWFCRRKKVGMLRFGEPLLPGLALGTALGRIGCFMNGCCYGSPSRAPWAVVLPELGDGAARHPAQLYASGLNLLLFFALLFLWRFRRREGDMLSFYMMGYGAVRFAVEFFRAGESSVVGWGGVTYAQWLSAGLFAAGVALLSAGRGCLPRAKDSKTRDVPSDAASVPAAHKKKK
ncbi:MAG: prolipoprotein diacylglyceryl transferase [bacterium]